jgi:hypothetical protein
LEYSLKEFEIFASVHLAFNLEYSESSPAKNESRLLALLDR